MISDFIKKISPQVGLEPTKMRHDLKKSVSVLPEGEEKILSFISDFSDREKLLKFEAESREFSKFLRSLEQFIQTVKGQNNFW